MSVTNEKRIGSIVCTPASALPGQSVLVEVKAPDGTAYNNTEKFYIGINGVPGSRQYLQFPRSGTQKIMVAAQGPGGPEYATQTITIATPPAPAVAVPLTATAVATTATTTTAVAPPAPPILPAHEWARIGVPILNLTRQPNTRYGVQFNVGQTLARARSVARSPAKAVAPTAALGTTQELLTAQAIAERIYEWDFGDGTKLTTAQPQVTHDFEHALDPSREYQQFNVTVTSAGKSVSRTLTVHNAYFHIKAMYGVMVPAVDSTAMARKVGQNFVSTLTVHNTENEVLTLTDWRIVPMSADDNEQTNLSKQARLDNAIAVPAKSSLAIKVTVPVATVPIGSAGFSVYYAGTSANRAPVRVCGHFDIAPEDRDLSKLAEINSVLADLTQSGKTALPAWMASNVRQSITSSSAAARTAVARLKKEHNVDIETSRTRMKAKLPPKPGPAVAGNVCDPDNLPAGAPATLACQATAETEQVPTPGRFMNARKGDLILSPGGSGLIGQLLRQVTPPQKWDHSGMMTANHTWITHCTASQDRMMAEAYWKGSFLGTSCPTDGLRADVVKFGWPGVISQTVENAVGDPQALGANEPFVDPDPANKGASYTISAFSAQPQDVQLGNAWVLIQPLVVKPDPMVETEEMRAVMGEVADTAAANTGKAHYRFFCYTDPTIGETTTAPAGTGSDWATGTFPAVCSSFVWLMQKKHNVHLQSLNPIVKQGDLVPAEIAQGAAVGSNTPDGLYLYGAAERLAAGEYLYNAIYNMAQDLIDSKTDGSFIGSIVEGLTQTATHIGNEMLNSFADDTTVQDDGSTAWQQTKDANAVSPEDLTFWQSAAKFGGVFGNFGFAEPAVYREPRIDMVTVYRWRTVQAKGTLSGKVSFNGKPVAGALVQLNAGLFAHSDAQGGYKIENVPYGKYVATSQKEQNGEWLSSAPTVDLEHPVQTQDIALHAPPDLYRTAVVTGSLFIEYTYSWNLGITRSVQTKTFPIHLELKVGPYGTHAQQTFSQSVNSATASITVTADWKVDKSIDVAVTFQQDDEVNPARPNGSPLTFNIQENRSISWHGWSSTSKNDTATLNFVIANNVQQD